jgi:hypothetical protein
MKMSVRPEPEQRLAKRVHSLSGSRYVPAFTHDVRVQVRRMQPNQGDSSSCWADLGERVYIIHPPNMQKWTVHFAHGRPVSVDCTFGITRYGYAVFTITGMDSVPQCPSGLRYFSVARQKRTLLLPTGLARPGTQQRPGFQPSVFSDDSQAEQNAIAYATIPRCISVLTHTTCEYFQKQRLKGLA